ncbi:MAG: glycosyltransferase family 4 protein [bacterium]
MKVVLVWNGPLSLPERRVLARRELPLLQRLGAEGIRITVVLLGDDLSLTTDLRAANIEHEVLPFALPPRAGSLRRLPAAVVGLRRLLARVEPDLVEGDDVMPAIAAGLAARSRSRAVIVYRRHHSGGRPPLIAASRVAARLADRTLVSCEAMRHKAAADDRVSQDRVHVATSGVVECRSVNALELSAARREVGLGEGTRVIGVIARLRHAKGIDVLLDSLDHLGDMENVHVCIVGTGPDAQSLQLRAQRAPLPVHFLGNRDDVEPWITLADVIAMPSRHESLGRVTLEAMRAARPIVASRVGGLTDAVTDGVNGLLVPVEDPQALATALRMVLGDRVFANRLGDAGRTRYQTRYTLEHMAEGWRSAWEHALRAHRGSRS